MKSLKITVDLFSDEVRFKQRSILWYLVFFGFSINYCIRINVNIAIVDMIDENFRKTTNTSIESECFEKLHKNSTMTTENSTTFAPKEEGKRFPSLETKLLDALGVKIVLNVKSHDQTIDKNAKPRGITKRKTLKNTSH